MRLKNGLFLLFLLLTSGKLLSAQKLQKLRGILIDINSLPVPDANVLLIKDSLIITGTSTNKEGHYMLEAAPSSAFTLYISHINFKTCVTPFRDTIRLFPRENTLDEVKIQASPVKYKANHYQANLKNNPLTRGKNADSFLGLLPGIKNYNGWTVNNTPAKIYIDGRAFCADFTGKQKKLYPFFPFNRPDLRPGPSERHCYKFKL